MQGRTMSTAEACLVHPRSSSQEVRTSWPLVSAGTPGLQLSVYHELTDFETEWRAFEQTADCTVFQTFDWLHAWQTNIGIKTNTLPAIVSARGSDGQLLFILPLAIRARGMVRELRFLGGSLCDYNGPLLAPAFTSVAGPTFGRVWSDICALLQSDARFAHDLVVLDKMPEMVGSQPNPFLQLPTALNPSGAYAMTLSSDWDTLYAAKRSSATRRRDRTKRKRLAESGDVQFVAPSSPAERAALLDTLMQQKSRAFVRMGVPNIFAPPGHREFYFDAVNRAGFQAHVSSLNVGDVCVAANLGLVFSGRYYHVLASYDDGPLSKFGPGAAHLHELMRYASENGCDTFDFTIGDEGYKRDWSDQILILHDHVSAASRKGAAVAGVASTARKIKRGVKQNPFLWKAVSQGRALVARLRGRAPVKAHPERPTSDD
ncbi:MAG: hypothetical protein QOD74_1034 [Variibacter sp.]|nr:hypothetical protein [Variibacter sp.]